MASVVEKPANLEIRTLANVDQFRREPDTKAPTASGRDAAAKVLKMKAPEVSSALSNARLTFSTQAVSSADEAAARLKQIFGNTTRDLIYFAPSDGRLLSDLHEDIVRDTNELLEYIQNQVDGVKGPLTQPDLLEDYVDHKKFELDLLVNNLNEHYLKGNARVEQDPQNPLLVAFHREDASDPIEVRPFRNLDIAVNALSAIRSDIETMREVADELSSMNDFDESPRIRDLQANYSPRFFQMLVRDGIAA